MHFNINLKDNAELPVSLYLDDKSIKLARYIFKSSDDFKEHYKLEMELLINAIGYTKLKGIYEDDFKNRFEEDCWFILNSAYMDDDIDESSYKSYCDILLNS